MLGELQGQKDSNIFDFIRFIGGDREAPCYFSRVTSHAKLQHPRPHQRKCLD